jgi:hypothetical protein
VPQKKNKIKKEKNRHIYEEETQIKYKYMDRCSISLVTKMQIKIRHNLSPVELYLI